MPCVVQRRLFQPRSQTQRWRFPRPGLVQSTFPLDCTNQRPRADFPSVCVFTASLSLFVHVPLVYACQRLIDFSCVHAGIHSRPPIVCAGQRPRGRPPSCSHRHSQSPSLKFQVLVRTLGPGSPNLLNPDPQVRFGLARWMNPNLLIGSGSGANPVHQVCEPDHGQSMAHACRKFLHFPDENNTGKRTHMRVFTPRGLHNTTTCLVTHALGTHALCLFCFHRSF